MKISAAAGCPQLVLLEHVEGKRRSPAAFFYPHTFGKKPPPACYRLTANS
jgi:hypothetical protein